MLLLLSPAKKLDYDSPVRTTLHTQPLFIKQAQLLIDLLKNKSQDEIAKLMKLSDSLAELNVQRYRDWQPEFNLNNARQSVLAFNGDVYDGLNASTMSDTQLQWAQEHLIILSGLYGALRPLDLMQPYRLEMGTRLQNNSGRNLYEFWGTSIAEYINQRLKSGNGSESGQPVVVHLASEEYFKAVDKKTLNARVVQCVFQEYRNGVWKVISFNAKRARGLMARYIIENQLTKPEQLQGFRSKEYNYVYSAEQSSINNMVFRRES